MLREQVQRQRGYLLKSSKEQGEWIPYFGNQYRFQEFVKELLFGLDFGEGDTFIETNSGSHAITCAARDVGMNTITNDLSPYSVMAGNVLYGMPTGTHPPISVGCITQMVEALATGSALLEKTWEPTPNTLKSLSKERVEYWKSVIPTLRKKNEQMDVESKIFNLPLDLFLKEMLHFEKRSTSGKSIVYIDFAWPWRDGRSTEQYEVVNDPLLPLLDMTPKQTNTKMDTGRSILNTVAETLDISVKVGDWVILSNQSSNFPSPEVLEPYLDAIGHSPCISRRLTVPAEDVDNCGLHDTFTEYQYVIKGSECTDTV